MGKQITELNKQNMPIDGVIEHLVVRLFSWKTIIIVIIINRATLKAIISVHRELNGNYFPLFSELILEREFLSKIIANFFNKTTQSHQGFKEMEQAAVLSGNQANGVD